MNTRHVAASAVFLVALIAGCAAPSASPAASGSAPSGSAAPRVLPVASNPIVNDATADSLEITKAAVEDNEDPVTHAPIDDRLQITVRNTGDTTLTGFEVYYSMTDTATGAKEGYYQRLDGFELPAGDEATISFDNETGPGHYPENEFSLYRSSTNQVDFEIQVSADGARIATATASKEAGAGEEPD